MADTSEDNVRLLEKEIQERNELIAILLGSSLASRLFGGYFHEMHNRITHLSFLLSSHFEMCREKSADQDVSEITKVFEDLQDIHESMGDTFLVRWPRNNVSVEECIQTAIKILHPYLQKSEIMLNTGLERVSSNLRVPKKEFTNVLLCILMNAIDALQNRTTRLPFIDIQSYYQGKTTSITITDNGNGIDEKIIARIWEPGFTTRRGRSGLGLAWARLFVVESLGGQITAESKLGEFTKVNIILQEEQVKDYENTAMD